MTISSWIIPTMENNSEKFVEKTQTDILCSKIFLPKIVSFIR